MTTDPFTHYKSIQREAWAFFTPLEAFTTLTAAFLVDFAGVNAEKRVLDVGCGTGVVAVTAARRGAHVSALDLSPVLLDRARQNAELALVTIDYAEGDVESLPYQDESFDFVLSQFGHMFAPRPDVAISEMLRVLKPGGCIAFSTWPPELFMGQMFSLVLKYLPPPEGVSPPPLWGDPNIIRERLGKRISNLLFDRQMLLSPSLSPQHSRFHFEHTSGSLVRLREKLSVEDPKALNEFRREYESLIAQYVRGNTLQQHYLMTRAIKI